MKKIITVILATIIHSTTLFSCQIMLENDIDAEVAVTDLTANHPTDYVKKTIKIEANKDPDIHADLRVTINPHDPLKKASYRVKQIACSQNHIIPITTSSILKGTLDPRIFTVYKERILTPRGI